MLEGPVELLLVEDNPADQELTLHVLKRHNLANGVRIARDGAEALEYFFGADGAAGVGDNVPRIILLDLKLPKVSGIEVLTKLKSDPRTKRMPVVMLTSSWPVSTASSSKAAEASGSRASRAPGRGSRSISRSRTRRPATCRRGPSRRV